MYKHFFQDLYESIDKKFKLENTMLRNKGLEEELSENFPYKIIIDRMAKHIVYGNINIIIVYYMRNVFSK